MTTSPNAKLIDETTIISRNWIFEKRASDAITGLADALRVVDSLHYPVLAPCRSGHASRISECVQCTYASPYQICHECCCNGGWRLMVCLGFHSHYFDLPICPTSEAIRKALEG